MSDIRSALEDAFTNAETTESTTVEPVVSETPEIAAETVADTTRDEQGRFAAQAPKSEPVEPAPVLEAAPVRKAPSSWKPDAQAAFLKADRGEVLNAAELKLLTAEAERREGDFLKGVGEFKSHADRARSYDQAVAPYQEHLQRLGVDAPTAIGYFFNADLKLRDPDPVKQAQFFKQIANDYKVNLSLVNDMPAADPQTQYLMGQLNELRQTQQVWQNKIQQRERADAENVISQFASADKPHLDAVRNDMADLLESGKAQSLQDAYEMAVWMRPDTRSTLIEQQRNEAQRKAIETAGIQRAKTAAISVKGSSPSAGGVQPVKGSLRDILEANFADN